MKPVISTVEPFRLSARLEKTVCRSYRSLKSIAVAAKADRREAIP
jgi:hypothetical protein